jgi:hypothetical protein
MARDFLSVVYERSPWERPERFAGYVDHQSFLTEPEVFDVLLDILKPQTIIEVGSWKGHSANTMADKLKALGIAGKIICVDTFLGSQEHFSDPGYLKELYIEDGRPTVFERFMANTLARGNQDIILPFPLPAATAAVVMSNFGFKADLVYIDAGHEYADVTSDITSFWPLLSEGGVMFGDDYPHAPLQKAVKDFAEAHNLKIISKSRKWMYATERLIEGLSASLYVMS